MTKLKHNVAAIERVTITPVMATELLEHNSSNRPISDPHVHRIAAQIMAGKWRFNGDTIKVAEDEEVIDGQHRLWAVIEAKTSIDTVIVRGVEREAFATIDTIRRPRSGGDTLFLSGATRHAKTMASTLSWLLRWQRKAFPNYKDPKHKVENADIEVAYAAHPGILHAVERVRHLRGLANEALLAFLYYVMTNHNEVIAEQMLNTLEDPSGVGVNDPFFRLRAYFTNDHHKRRDPVTTIALAIKAANAAHEGRKVQLLSWKNQGERAEIFPELKIS